MKIDLCHKNIFSLNCGKREDSINNQRVRKDEKNVHIRSRNQNGFGTLKNKTGN